jgi:hypothetical protein
MSQAACYAPAACVTTSSVRIFVCREALSGYIGCSGKLFYEPIYNSQPGICCACSIAVLYPAAGLLVGLAMGLVAGRLADRFHRMKPTLVALCAVNVGALVLFSAVAQPAATIKSTAVREALLWTTGVLSNGCLYAAVPLFFELCVETAWPCANPTLVLFVAVTVNNLSNLCLLFVPVSSSAAPFNWAYTAGCALTLALLAWGFREELHRFDFDAAAEKADAANATDTASGVVKRLQPGLVNETLEY